jgi:signal transduction histidine kinase/ligand-binding sensor domain-containing protein
MALKNYLVWTSLLLFGRWATAQTLPQEAHFNRYTVADGLPGNTINGIEQDNQGFIWIATDAGLSCFDGVHFTNYFKGKDRRHSLPSNDITDILKLPDGKIALATGFGLCLLDPLRRTFKTAWIPCEPEMEVVINKVHPVVLTNRGHLATGGSAGFSVFDTAMNLVFHYAHFKKEDLNKTRMGFTHDLQALSNGDVLIRGWDGFWRYNASENCLEKQDPQAFGTADWKGFQSPGKEYMAIWGLYFPDSLRVQNLETGKAGTTRITPEIKYKLHWRSTLRFVNDTLMGFAQCDFGFRTAICDPATLRLRFSDHLIFSDQHFNAFFLDREGRWWLASENGLFAQTFSKSRFRHVPLPTNAHRLETSMVPTAITKAGAHFFVGTADELFVLDERLNLLKRIIHPVKAGQIWNLHNWQPGSLDLGCSDAWLRLRLPRQWNEPLQWTQIGPPLASLTQVKDRWGDVWVGTAKGLFRYNPPTGREYRYGKGQSDGEFPYGGALRIMQTDSGYLWMCGLPGFTRWNPFTQTFDRQFPRASGTETTEGYPATITSNGGEELLFALRGNGLWLWSGDAQAARRVETGNPALELVQEIFPDLHPHRFWLLLRSGLALLDVSTGQYRYLSTGDALPDQPLVDNCFYLDPATDSVYCCHQNGLLVFNRRDVSFSDAPVPVFITEVLQISGRQTQPLAAPFQLSQPGNNIVVSFASPDFEQGRLLDYAYRLDGGAWQNLDNAKSLRLVNLAPGSYFLEIKSVTPDGVSSEPATLSFRVMPYFYQTSWFKILVFVATAMAAFGWFRWRLAQLRKVETMRQSIAADLHDEVGASLTSIQILSQLAAHPDLARRSEALEKLPEQVRRTSASLREIVWNIQPKHDALHLLLSQLTRYAGEVFEKSDIQYSVQTDEFPEGATLDPATRQHFTRIFKEVLSNLVRHSGAGRAAVFFKKENRHLVMTVRDDGKGFDVGNVRRGNGLDNMQVRAAAVGGRLSLRSSTGEGTEIALELPLKLKKAGWRFW